jgi:hypothetical protein
MTMPSGVTYTPVPPIEGKKFVCKRCKRVYPYPEAGDRPIRCECGWWYFNDGSGIRETYNQRIEPYRAPGDFHRLFRH